MSKDIPVKRNNQSLSLADRNPFSDFDRMVDRLFGDRFGSLMGEFPIASRRTFGEVKETDKAYILCAEIPGVPKEDITIDVNGNLLTISAEHREEDGAPNEESGYRREYRTFQQSFSLPSTIDADKIEAHCENGLLEVWLPKVEMAQPKRVEVQSGKGGFLNRIMGKKTTESGAKDVESKKH